MDSKSWSHNEWFYLKLLMTILILYIFSLMLKKHLPFTFFQIFGAIGVIATLIALIHQLHFSSKNKDIDYGRNNREIEQELEELPAKIVQELEGQPTNNVDGKSDSSNKGGTNIFEDKSEEVDKYIRDNIEISDSVPDSYPPFLPIVDKHNAEKLGYDEVYDSHEYIFQNIARKFFHPRMFTHLHRSSLEDMATEIGEMVVNHSSSIESELHERVIKSHRFDEREMIYHDAADYFGKRLLDEIIEEAESRKS